MRRELSISQGLREKRHNFVHPVIDVGVVIGELLIPVLNSEPNQEACQPPARHREG